MSMKSQTGSRGTGRSSESDPKDKGTQGGSHEQHVKAGQQSHKNDGGSAGKRSGSSSGGKSSSKNA